MLVEDHIAAALLDWYDAHARTLPWRSPPGTPPPDPYKVWLSEIMLQQTGTTAAAPYYRRFLDRWPTVAALAAAEEGELMAAWAGLGYYARARNLLAAARAVTAAGGHFPADEEALRALPGIGAYTAAAIAAIAFGRRAVVVDGNVERVVARLHALETPLPAARAEIRQLTGQITPPRRCGDFAQAMMDLGATICTPRAPRCHLCPLAPACVGQASGRPQHFPVRLPKAARPRRFATAFRVERSGALLLVRRPARGLLGGLLALPIGPIADADPKVDGAPFPAEWRPRGAPLVHVFTHFALALQVVEAPPPATFVSPAGAAWWPVDRLDDAGMPTLFRRAAAAAHDLASAA